MKKTLRVVYDGHPDHDMEKELRELLDRHGYKWYAQGYDFVAEKRDIAFDLPSDNVLIPDVEKTLEPFLRTAAQE